ncbi:MAG TPA: hypothetical protein VG826_02705 [Pirellulales bacterium]|nr:hypothetical protein [Pirellulales bacterium]
MDIGSLFVVVLALSGQVRQPPADTQQAEQQESDFDRSIEEADDAADPTGAPDRPGNATEPAERKSAAADRRAVRAKEPPADAGGSSAAGEAEDDLTPLQDVSSKPGTADALLQWLAEGDTALEGKRVALVDLLSRVYDRPQQAIIVAAYWKLSAAVAEYRIAADEVLRLEQLLPPAEASGKHASDPVLEAHLAAAEARLREAELAAVSQQFALAEQMRLPANEPLPLANDLPHAGAYRTFFQERYSRTAPPRSHLIDRTLPLLQRSVELRAAAAVSAADSAEAEAEAYHAGQLDLLAAVDRVGELTRQRRAFVAAVRDYNLDIAEYALSVAPAALTSAQLVGMLIGPPRTAPASNVTQPKQVAEEPNGVKAAGFNAPITGSNATPTLAPPQPGSSGGTRKKQGDQRGGAPGGRRRPSDQNESSQTRPTIKSISPGATSRGETIARRHVAGKPPEGTGRYDAVADDDSGLTMDARASAPVDQGLYGALAGLSPLKRAQELSATLHWDRQVTAEQGTPTSLADALAAAAGPNKRALVQAYWGGREQIAAAQVVAQEADLLKSLQAAALSLHDQPGGAEAMLRLRTAQLSADAAEQEAAIGVLSGQFDLAQLMRRPPTGPWPWPVTPPHAGGYRLKLDEQSSAVQQVSLVRQVSKAIPARQEILQRHADAVVAADAARVEFALGFEQGTRRLSDALAAVRELSNETLAFLDAQTQYNVQFADYVMAVAPPGTPDATLAGVLVVSR